jgi:hypothetical protein
MAHRELRLTDEAVAKLPFADGERGMYIVRDSEIPGFRLIVNRNTKRYVFQSENRIAGKRSAIYRRIGDPAHVPISEARGRARDEQARQERLTNPDAKAGMTFGAAWEAYEKALGKPRGKKPPASPRTVADYRQKFGTHLKDAFGKVALRDLRRADVEAVHERLTKEAGPYCANGTCRVGSAIYRHAALGLEVPDLPPLNPFRSYNLFNEEKSRQTGLSRQQLSAWFVKTLEIDNPIRREYWFVAALTGIRRNEIAAMQWVHVAADHIAIPTPKGGTSRAFKIPLTKALARSLKRLRRAAQVAGFENSPWVFPALSESGHISEPREDELGASPHALRHTFISLAPAAGVSELHAKLLTNHSVGSGDVHRSYMTVAAMFEQLAAEGEKMASFLVKAMGKGAERRLEQRLKEQLAPR